MKTINPATIAEYTMEVEASAPGCELFLLVKPGTDLDGRFKAFDTEEGEFIMVNGWMFSSEIITPVS